MRLTIRNKILIILSVTYNFGIYLCVTVQRNLCYNSAAAHRRGE